MKKRTPPRHSLPWFELAMLGLEAQRVIWLRMVKIAAGGHTAHRESALMVSEKLVAAAVAGQQAMLGASPHTIVRGYRKKVRANARRLAR